MRRDQLGGLSSQQALRMFDLFFFISVFLPWGPLMFWSHQAQLILTSDCIGSMLGPQIWAGRRGNSLGSGTVPGRHCLPSRHTQVFRMGCGEESTIGLGGFCSIGLMISEIRGNGHRTSFLGRPREKSQRQGSEGTFPNIPVPSASSLSLQLYFRVPSCGDMAGHKH